MDLIERTRAYYCRVDAGDVAGVLDWFADDAVYHRGGYQPMVGRTALAEFYWRIASIGSGSPRCW
jgi:ketosteroid isomerase-like protein